MISNIIIGVRTHLSTFFTQPQVDSNRFATDEEAKTILKKIINRVWWQGFLWGSMTMMLVSLILVSR